ncbi:THO complex subunit 2-like [Arapaima gigas]
MIPENEFHHKEPPVCIPMPTNLQNGPESAGKPSSGAAIPCRPEDDVAKDADERQNKSKDKLQGTLKSANKTNNTVNKVPTSSGSGAPNSTITMKEKEDKEKCGKEKKEKLASATPEVKATG